MGARSYLLVVPVLALLTVVEVYPLLYTVYLSLTNYGPGNLSGLSNYSQALSTGFFAGAVGTSLVYSVGTAALSFVLGLLFAFEIWNVRRGKGALTAVLVAPLAAAPVFAGVLWSPSGVWDDLDTFWHFVLGQPFFNSASYWFFFPVMIISDAWEWAPLMMLVILGVFAGIPKEVLEAADVAGASSWAKFRKVMVPAVLGSPVVRFVLVIRFVDAMRTFEIPFTWSTWISLPQAGSPADTVSLLIFKLFTLPEYNFPIGEISAMAVALLLLTLIATTVVLRLIRRSVSLYE